MLRKAFCISDGTGITSETLGRSLLSQFNTLKVEISVYPYIDSIEKAKKVVHEINSVFAETQQRPIIIDTIINPEIRSLINQSNGLTLDIFSTFLSPLEKELGIKSSYSVGLSHTITTNQMYDHRMAAVNFALDNDDGTSTIQYQSADVILLGVSRCGKTPTCLYLALQFGIKAANYPLTEEDLEELTLPKSLKTNKEKLFGLTISPDRLASIRHERCPNTRYASLDQCSMEVEETEKLYKREKIPFIDTTEASVEELSTHIIKESKLHRHLY